MREKIIDHCARTLKCERLLLHKKTSEVSGETDKEKLLIFNVHYRFIHNESCLRFIEKSIAAVKNEINLVEDDVLALIIVILKSFLNKFSINLTKQFYVDSDEIFNYIVKYFKFYLINLKRYMPEHTLKITCLYAVQLLVNADLIEELKINTASCSFFKTKKNYSIVVDYSKSIDEYMIFSYNKYKLIEYEGDYYVTSGHFFTTYEIFRKNFNSNRGFKLKNIEYIMNKINSKIYVDSDYQESLKNLLGVDRGELLKQINERTVAINNYYKDLNWTANTKSIISDIQSQISKSINLLIYDFFSSYNFNEEPIYFPMYLDFRGRQYYYSNIGPTASKLLRLAYFYGWYRQEDIKENNLYSKNYTESIERFCRIHNLINNGRYYETYFWILIGVGKFFIDKEKYPIKIEEFLEKGILCYDRIDQLDIEKKIEILHYRRIVRDLSLKKIKKRALLKDATASLNQVFMKKLGPLDQLSMNYVNLGENWEWYDTYTVCKYLFYEYIKNNHYFKEKWSVEAANGALLRPVLKDSVMKIPYSAGNRLCWSNYQEIVARDRLKIKITADTKKLMLLFYDFVRKDMQELYLYNKTSSSLVNKLSEDFENLRKYVLESNTGEADISYYKMQRSSIDKKYTVNGEKKRITKLILKPSEALDKKAFEIAAGANTVHFLDADEIRIIEGELGYSVITIHDSYLIDFLNCSKLIEIRLGHYQREISKIAKGYTIRNIFILL